VHQIRISSSGKKTYARPILQRSTLQQFKTVLSSIKTIFSHNACSHHPKVVAITSKLKKHYEKPGYKKLTPEQVKLILIGQFSLGDEGAGDLLQTIFSERNVEC
jgi:hypothetical protein